MTQEQEIRLGRKSIAALVDHLRYNWRHLEQLMFKQGLDHRFSGQNRLAALSKVFHPLVYEDADPAEAAAAREVYEEIAQGLWQRVENDSIWHPNQHAKRGYEYLLNKPG